MSNKVLFEEITPGTFIRNKNFHIKSNFWTDGQYNEIDDFCYNIRGGIANLIDGQMKVFRQNLCKKEFNELQKIIVNKNEVHIINDTDKNLGAVIANNEEVILECKRQLFDIKTYLKLSMEEMLIAKNQTDLEEVDNKHKSEKTATTKKLHLLNKSSVKS